MLRDMTLLPANRVQRDLGALEASVDRAGLALACAYSSAAEFEAEVIRVRRAAGAYARPRMGQLRLVLAATAAVSLAALLVVLG